jgi:CHAT domain-containing protein
MYSYIVLSQSRVNENEDGLLEAREIMDLDLKCDLVVLAACNTARGRISRGEGVIGIAWSFFIAGCPAIVVSQWAVESSSTAALMIEFHKTLKAAIDGQKPDVGKAEALRIAALKLLRTPRYRHPFYWAPFVIIGDDRPASTLVRSL